MSLLEHLRLQSCTNSFKWLLATDNLPRCVFPQLVVQNWSTDAMKAMFEAIQSLLLSSIFHDWWSEIQLTRVGSSRRYLETEAKEIQT